MFLLVICFLSGDKDISRKWAHRGHTPSLFRVSFIPHLTDQAVCKTIRGVFISHRSSLTGVKDLFSAPFALSVDKTNGKVLRKFYQKFNSSIWIPFDFHEKFYFADCRQFFAFHGNKSSWIRIFLSHPGQAFSPAPLRRLGRNMIDNVKFIKIDYISWYLFHGGFFLRDPQFLADCWTIAEQWFQRDGVIQRTTSTSEGIRDKKSMSSLLSTAFGLRIFFVNLFIPGHKQNSSI